MSIVFVTQQGADSAQTNGTHPSFTLGSGGGAPVNGDRMLAIIANNKATVMDTRPSGWTNQQAQFNNGSTAGSGTLSMDDRVAASDSGATPQWTLHTNSEFLAFVLEYSGVDPTTPYDIAIQILNSGTGINLPTPTNDGCRVVYVCAWGSNTNTVTADPSAGGTWTLRRNATAAGTNIGLAAWDLQQGAKTAINGIGPTFSGTPGKILHMLIVLRPVAGIHGGSGVTSDAVPVAGVLARLGAWARALADSVAVSDVFTGFKSIARGLSDNVPIATVLTRGAITRSRSTADTALVSQSLARRATLTSSLLDSVNVGTVLTGSKSHIRNNTDSVPLATSMAVRVRRAVQLTDIFPINENLVGPFNPPPLVPPLAGDLDIDIRTLYACTIRLNPRPATLAVVGGGRTSETTLPPPPAAPVSDDFPATFPEDF